MPRKPVLIWCESSEDWLTLEALATANGLTYECVKTRYRYHGANYEILTAPAMRRRSDRVASSGTLQGRARKRRRVGS